jgi:putative flippase GtrA
VRVPSSPVVRFVAVGIASNLALYLLYLIITGLGVGYKIAMTGLYVLGIAQTFIANKTWTFAHRGEVRGSLVRYLVAYGLGYVLNLGTLLIFVDKFGLPHQLVQGLAVILVALCMFLMQRYWVFASGSQFASGEHE